MGDESRGLEQEEERVRARAEEERIILRRLENEAPETLDARTPSQKRDMYEGLGPKVLAHRDKTLIITWFMDKEIGRFGCPSGRTSTR